MKEKKQRYETPAVRETDVRIDTCFLPSTIGGGIDPWIEDDGSVNP